MRFLAILLISAACFGQQVMPIMGSSTAVSVALPTWTIVQHPLALGCSGTTCSVTLTQAFGAGNVKVVQAQYTSNPVYIVSDTKGGTLVQCPSTLGADGTNGGHPIAYTLSTSSSTTGADVVTFSATTTANVRVLELHPSSGSPAAALDFCNVLTLPSSGTSYVGPAATMTGSNDAVAIMAATANNVTAVTSPYSSNQDISSGNLWATALDQTSVSTPTYTVSSAGVTSVGTIGFGFNTTACLNQSYVPFEGTNNSAVTEVSLRGTTNGWSGGVWGLTGTALKFQNAASHDITNATGRLCGDGESYATGATTTGIQYLSSTGTSYEDYTWGAGLSSADVSAGIWFNSDFPTSDDSILDVFTIRGATDFVNAKFWQNVGATSRAVQLEAATGSVGSIDLATSTWYWISLQYRAGAAVNHSLKVYTAGGSLVGTITAASNNSGNAQRILVGNSTSPYTGTSGNLIKFDSLKIDITGTYPLLP